MSATTMATSQWNGAHASEIIQLAREAARTFFALSSLLARLTLAVLRPLILLLQPLALRGLRVFWRRFASQSPRAIALQISASIACVSLALLERRYGYGAHGLQLCRRLRAAAAARYLILLHTVRAQSRIAAAALPHILYLIGALLIEYVLGRMLSPYARAPLFYVAACARPVLRTVALVYVLESAPLYGLTPAPSRMASASASESDENNGSPSRTPPRSPTMNALSALRRRATLVAERIANARSSSSDDSEAVSSGSDISDESGKRLIKADSSPAYPGSPVRTLPATGLVRSRRPRTSLSDADELAARRCAEVETLQLWVVTALVLAFRSVFRFVCPSIFTGVLMRTDIGLFYIVLWLQASFTGGFHIAYRLLAAATGKNVARNSDATSAKRAQLGMLLNLLVSFGMLSQERANMVSSSLAESGVALIGAIFFVTPRVLTYGGTVFVGALAPAYLTASVLQVSSGAADRRRNWLTYWAVFAVCEAIFSLVAIFMDWFPLLYHIKMAVILWLQLPYYRGASLVLHVGLTRVLGLVNHVGRNGYTPRKVKFA